MKKTLLDYIVDIAAVCLFLMTATFIICSIILKLYTGLHPLLWLATLIISIIIYSKFGKVKIVKAFASIEMILSLLRITIDIAVMYFRLVMLYPLYLVLCGAIFLVLIIADDMRSNMIE